MPDNTLTIHCLAAEFDTDIDHELDAMRYHRSRVNLITKAEPIGTDDLIQLTTSAKVRAFSPLTPGLEPKVSRQGDKVTITLPEKCAYAVIALT
jgi:hypothetical protein